jgi:hypothetical protein
VRVVRPAAVRVVPAKEEYRKTLKHLPSGVPFPPAGPAEWPLDQFTQRRLRDGSVTLEGT